IEPAPAFHRVGDDALAGLLIGDVGLDHGAFPVIADHARRHLDIGAIGIDQRDSGAVAREQDRRGASVADALGAAARAGHDRDLALEAFFIVGHASLPLTRRSYPMARARA